MQRMASALIFLERHHKNGHESLNHIARVTGVETWVSSVNTETKERSKNWMPKKFKQTSACQKADGNSFWDRNGVLMVETMQTRDHNNVRSVFTNH
jgi:hypothetical protein